MTTQDRIAQLEAELRAAQGRVELIREALRDAKNDAFRERHGFGAGDQAVLPLEPAPEPEQLPLEAAP